MYLGLLILIGIPGSGKKNEWKSLRKNLASDIEKLIHALKSKNMNLIPTIFVNDLKNLKFLEENVVLIIDDNMYLKSMRYTLYQITKKNQIGFCEVFFNCSLEKALQKNNERQSDSIVSPEIIERMLTQIEVPNKKNAWEKYSLCINSFSDINEFHTDLFTILNNSLCNPEKISFVSSKEKQLSLLQCQTNIIHQADIALRKIVGEEIKKLSNVTPAEKKYHCLKLNEKKVDILADLKSGVIFLPTKIVSEIKNNEEKKFNNKYIE
ncbi:conserved hypothetical protein [Pediculus humanus corporis]|uniref:L-seryl-tRNA(Sec) kinase n=1 Tax=Pediculus humanus subsp. corporis TaxID=121224 RepID=E0VLZ2_PEDHC|nr:uncharacterized protein Phum_PHUM297960 [Pediculus humanus corporis]EEB14398.1 conserved hypothetical protein [Pediculus humanus corporis]